jgi:hypothetical protein
LVLEQAGAHLVNETPLSLLAVAHR